MKNKYKDEFWGTSLQKFPWDERLEKKKSELFISATMHEWYEAKHPKASSEEIEFINSFGCKRCHYCFSEHIIKYGKYRTGLIRFKCKDCGKTFNNLTNTIFDSHKIPISERFEYLLHLFEFHSIKSSSRDNKNANSTGKYWLIKFFEVLKNYQKNFVLSDKVVFDETYFTVVMSKRDIDKRNKLRGISRDKICIAVAYDGFRTIILSKNTSKPSTLSNIRTMKSHIKPGSTLIHDEEHSHYGLVKELDLKDEKYKSLHLSFLSEKENPLTPVNKIHSYIKKFMNSHEGFS